MDTVHINLEEDNDSEEDDTPKGSEQQCLVSSAQKLHVHGQQEEEDVFPTSSRKVITFFFKCRRLNIKRRFGQVKICFNVKKERKCSKEMGRRHVIRSRESLKVRFNSLYH